MFLFRSRNAIEPPGRREYGLLPFLRPNTRLCHECLFLGGSRAARLFKWFHLGGMGAAGGADAHTNLDLCTGSNRP